MLLTTLIIKLITIYICNIDSKNIDRIVDDVVF